MTSIVGVMFENIFFNYHSIRSQGNSFSRDVLHDQIDGIDTELTWLQDQLATGGLNIDAASLLGVGLDSITIAQVSLIYWPM